MSLVFGHLRLDRRQFPHLMPQRLRIAARKLRPAAAACGWCECLDVVALLGRNQRPLVPGVTRLAASFLFRLGLLRRQPGMGMLARWRQGRILRRLAEPRFEPGNLPQQYSNDGLSLGAWRPISSSVISSDMPLVSPKLPAPK